MNPTMLRHGRIDLALWTLRSGQGRPLVLVHGLGESSPTSVPDEVAGWTGPIHALDLTGHGNSTVPSGGGYYCEVLMADIDTVIGRLGPITVLGRGLGGYLALLVAGARPLEVRGAIIADGPGLLGGGERPSTNTIVAPPFDARLGVAPDPYALVELAGDVRPPDYARSFAWQASALSGLETIIAIAAANRPPWLAEVATQPGVVEATVEQAIELFGAVAD